MCARIVYLFLAAVFIFVVTTIAAFVHLEWWQAVLVSAATFIALVYIGKLLVRRTVRQVKNMVAKSLFDGTSRVLRNADVDIHSVRPAVTPRGAVDRANTAMNTRAGNPTWYEIEATIFPDRQQTGTSVAWDLNDLRLVPADPPDANSPIELHDLVLIENGSPVIPIDTKFDGPRRVRFTAGVPRGVRELQFRYQLETFGLVKIPGILGQ
ncbi:hypothetical protein [Fimbriiglobus ruber]|uniref:Uncharacterized protein n=1 Tax=Fimbriiglobus ruber TaxID=1908690 RepID=A0A225DD84_9BACT|nr:hypothetical protein [Fimbriiglobus ruber]OWK36488.1 hypothetical protein FRUB_09051 [Fimbriiglobus ruber]